MTATVGRPARRRRRRAGTPCCAPALAVVVGLLCLAAWALRLGFVADLLSRPDPGRLPGRASPLIMMVGQLRRLTGVATTGRHVRRATVVLRRHTRTVAGADHCCLARRGPRVPVRVHGRLRPDCPGRCWPSLLATAAVAVFDLDDARHRGGRRGPGRAADPGLPDLRRPAGLVLPALGVLVVGYTDNILTARAFADPCRAQTRRQPELLALGRRQPRRRAAARFPGQQQRQPHRARRRPPAPARQLYSLVALGAVLAVLLFLRAAAGALPDRRAGRHRRVRRGAPDRPRRVPAAGRRSAAASCCWPSPRSSGVLVVDILYGVLVAVGAVGRRAAAPGGPSPRRHPGSGPRAGRHARRRRLSRRRGRFPAWSSTATTRRCSSPTRRTSGVGPWPPSTAQAEPVAWFVLNVEANVEVDITALDAVERAARRS